MAGHIISVHTGKLSKRKSEIEAVLHTTSRAVADTETHRPSSIELVDLAAEGQFLSMRSSSYTGSCRAAPTRQLRCSWNSMGICAFTVKTFTFTFYDKQLYTGCPFH